MGSVPPERAWRPCAGPEAGPFPAAKRLHARIATAKRCGSEFRRFVVKAARKQIDVAPSLKRGLQMHQRKCLCARVMLRLYAPYVSKPAILRALVFAGSPEIQVPIEFQGFGVASQRRFASEFGKPEERFRGR